MAWRFYTIFIAWVVVEWVVVWRFYPETKGPSLEEIALIFDGPGDVHLKAEAQTIEKAVAEFGMGGRNAGVSKRVGTL